MLQARFRELRGLSKWIPCTTCLSDFSSKCPLSHCAVQDIVDDGGYHPSVNQTMIQRVTVEYTPSQYPPAYLQAQGYRCGCGEFYNNTCRSEFRQVSHA